MQFARVAQAFQEIEQEQGRTKITAILADLFKQASPTQASIIAYCALGSLNPPYIGTQFNFSTKGLVAVMAALTGLGEKEIERMAHTAGDLGQVLASAMKHKESDLSVGDVEKVLKEILETSGIGAQEKKMQLIYNVLLKTDSLSAKYIVRIIEGKLRLGFSEMTLLDAFSWMEAGDKSLRDDLEDAYNVSADIGMIIKTLKEHGIAGIKKVTLTPGIPIRPSAAERMADAAAIIKKIGPCVAQPKLDGFRLQVHLDKRNKEPRYRFFSRNLLDMSDMFPDLARIVVDFDVQTLIVEGEAICVDVETNTFLPFQETVKRKRKYDIEKTAQEYPLMLYLFDLLYVDGVSYLNESHAIRRKKLLELCSAQPVACHNVIFPVQEYEIATADQLSILFEESVSLGLEGLVVKRPDAVYRPGKRNFNWIKLKRQESGSLDDTIDCVILGYYHGHGKRSGLGIGALLVGVYNPDSDGFQTIAKIGTGLTDIEWKEQKKACDQLKVDHKPANVECAKELFPDVWTSPELVCMIRADEITKSPLHTAGLTDKDLGFALRFPRFMGPRPDKKARDASNIDEIKQLYRLQFEKKNSKNG